MGRNDSTQKKKDQPKKSLFHHLRVGRKKKEREYKAQSSSQRY